VGEPLLPIRGKSMDLIIFRMTTAITAAARTVAGAGSGIGAADALDALLLFLTDIKNRRTQDQYNKGKNEEVLHSRHYFFSA